MCPLYPAVEWRGASCTLTVRLVLALTADGIEIAPASISSLNEPSLRFHRKHGFTESGRLRRIASKHNTPFDIVWLQRNL